MQIKPNTILDTRLAYKPLHYPSLFDRYKEHELAIWFPTEVPMADDLADFNSKLTVAERNLITQILRFFTTGDLEVGNNYHNHLISKFKHPEAVMMLGSFANRESDHVWAYSQLNDTLGLPDEDYSTFLEYEAMKSKYEYFTSFDVSNITSLVKNMAIFGGFIEGVSLFASFAILMNFPRRGLLKNVGQIISWSVLDENKHSEGVSELFKILIKEYPEHYTESLQNEIYEACSNIVELEDKFIDLCYEQGPVDGLTPEQVKQYIRYLADYRLRGLGLTDLFGVRENPLPWMVSMIYGKEHANFFESRATEYSKGGILGDMFD
jgi:ribonucleoside-diphosphate reductase beta chain